MIISCFATRSFFSVLVGERVCDRREDLTQMSVVIDCVV